MNLMKYLLPCALAACGFAASVQAQNDFSTTIEERESDVRALSDFVRSKGGVSVQEKGGNLMLSGDVRAEYEHVTSESRKHKLRGRKSGSKDRAPFATNEFDVEVNLALEYRADRTWAKIQLQFDNPMGIRAVDDKHFDRRFSRRNTLFGSGVFGNIALRRAYVGFNVAEAGTSRFDIEIGRRRLYDTFESSVQFHNFYDGITLKYANSYEAVMDFQVKAAAFVVDQTINYFGYIGEIGLLNLGDEGIDFKYSYINWHKGGKNRFKKKNGHGTQFGVSQFYLAYNFSPDFLRYRTAVYGAYLVNHNAKKTKRTHHDKENEGFFVGFRIGELRRQNDWAFQASYQWVQAQVIPESDVHGIGRDNPTGESFYRSRSRGFANYKGYSIDALYALTDNLTVNARVERVHQQNKRIGGRYRATWLDLGVIYAF